MEKSDINIQHLTDPMHIGAAKIEQFISPELLTEVDRELDELPFMDSHETYMNQRGLTIVQNHDTFAVDLNDPEHRRLTDPRPHIGAVRQKVEAQVSHLAQHLAGLQEWRPTELSIHRYDAEEGLSYHRDNRRFIGLIAIVSLQGESDLNIRNSEGEETAIATEPGDLLLLRAPGLIPGDDKEELRPEHAVRLKTDTRTSLMLRQNKRPHQKIPGFKFNNPKAD